MIFGIGTDIVKISRIEEDEIFIKICRENTIN